MSSFSFVGFKSHIHSAAQIKGPLLDDSAPYSAIGYVELIQLRIHLGLDDKTQLDPIFDALN